MAMMRKLCKQPRQAAASWTSLAGDGFGSAALTGSSSCTARSESVTDSAFSKYTAWHARPDSVARLPLCRPRRTCWHAAQGVGA